jgi:two-component system OmpR family sensor kinase
MLVVFILINAFTLMLLKGYLVGEIDDRLRASGPVQDVLDRPLRRPGPPDFIAARQPPDSLGAITANGSVIQAGIYDRTGQLRPVAEPDMATLATAGDATNLPSTLQLSEGSYRYISRPLPGGETAILGYSLEPAQSILQQLTIVGLLLSLAGLAVVTPALYFLTGAALRSLKRLTYFAESITAKSLQTKQFVLDSPTASPGDPAEVMTLTNATTEMLRQIAGSLQERDEKEAQLRRFISDASHELRTPLTVMHGYTEMAAHFAVDNPHLISLLDKIESGTQRLTELVSSMLTLARANAAEDMRQESFDLSALLEERFFRAMETYPTHQWVINQNPASVPFTGDRAQLATAIDALLDNAGKHSGAASSVSVELNAQADRVEISVVDDGRGIETDLNKIFEPFFTGDSARKRADSGNGLGLAISQAIIQAHHGSLTVASRIGRAVFKATLPQSGNGLPPLSQQTVP